MYIEHIKYYTDDSKWLVKLFLQFCHEYKFQNLMFEFDGMNRKETFNWLIKHPSCITYAVNYFDTNHEIIFYLNQGNSFNHIFYRRFMWKYFLLTHQKYIPKEFKPFIEPIDIIHELRRLGARKNDYLQKILDEINSNYDFYTEENILKTLKK